ncbi:hypothetical protein [Microcystis aeruginosa]|uniref:hypothetical protein n=1 Tax=Microcystis aeruginosa TaxID=1126 RepID=UPI00232AB601|nr:hypothetical protein [Microcystis aeruginosa]MDB9412947.1 hypothetical protein [Microcystis aeruginosa CS-567/02]
MGITLIAFLIHKRYIPDPEQLNQQRFKCAAQMREPLYNKAKDVFMIYFGLFGSDREEGDMTTLVMI